MERGQAGSSSNSAKVNCPRPRHLPLLPAPSTPSPGRGGGDPEKLDGKQRLSAFPKVPTPGSLGLPRQPAQPCHQPKATPYKSLWNPSSQGLSPGHISHGLQTEETREAPIGSLDPSQANGPQGGSSANSPKSQNDRCRDPSVTPWAHESPRGRARWER